MTAITAPASREKRGIPGLAQLQRIGRSLMLPIASLPAAALLLRLGQPDMLGKDGLAGAWGDWLLPVADALGAAAQGDRGHHGLGRAGLVRHRGHRAARVLVPLPRLPAVRDPRGAHRDVPRARQLARDPRRVRVLGRCD